MMFVISGVYFIINECLFLEEGAALHELGHALGLYHEQEHPLGMEYIRPKFENIEDGKGFKFRVFDCLFVRLLYVCLFVLKNKPKA